MGVLYRSYIGLYLRAEPRLFHRRVHFRLLGLFLISSSQSTLVRYRQTNRDLRIHLLTSEQNEALAPML